MTEVSVFQPLIKELFRDLLIIASRDCALPIVSNKILQQWAEEQADLVPNLWAEPDDQMACAQYIRICGGNTRGLPIAKNKDVWLSASQIKLIAAHLDTVILLDRFTLTFYERDFRPVILDDNVFLTNLDGIPVILQSHPHHTTWPEESEAIENDNNVGQVSRKNLILAGAVIEAVSEAWGAPLNESVLSANSPYREKNVRVGTDGEQEIRLRALVIERSKTTG